MSNSSAMAASSSTLSSAISSLTLAPAPATSNPDSKSIAKTFPFNKFPPELRNRVYTEILSSPDQLHVSRPRNSHEDHFVFCTCPHADTAMSGMCSQCLWEDSRGSGRVYLDTAIFHVSESIRNEAFRILLAANTLYFGDRDILLSFAQKFTQHSSHMLSLVLSARIYDEPLQSYELREIRQIVTCIPNLQHLTIYARVSSRSPPGFELHQSGVLNFFRPFVRLPLRTAAVHLVAWPNIIDMKVRANKPSSQTLQKLETRAVKKLLADPAGPEERQIRQPRVLTEAIEKLKETEKPKKFAPKLAPGVIIARMGVPDCSDTVTFKDIVNRPMFHR